MISHQNFIAYYRVSTGKQGQIGFGIEAQRAAVHTYVSQTHGQLIAEFSETMSGLKAERPELKKAISWSRIFRSTLIIAKLDRLARSVDLIARILDSGLEFVALDAPHANKFTLHILAALAEYESSLMSERMKAALAAAKSRGVDIPRSRTGGRFPASAWEASGKVRQAQAEARANDLAPNLRQAIKEGKSYAVIAKEFNCAGIVPLRKAAWSNGSIGRLVRITKMGSVSADQPRPWRKWGCAQIRVERQTSQIGATLVEFWRSGKTYHEISEELERVGILSPRGKPWGKASIRRYLIRALGVQGLRQAREVSK